MVEGGTGRTAGGQLQCPAGTDQLAVPSTRATRRSAGGGSGRLWTEALPAEGGSDGDQSFRVTLAGADFTDASDDADRVLAVCDDVIVSHELDGDLAVFDREAASFAAAVGSALAYLERSLPAARVLRVEAVPVAGELSVAAVS